TRFSRDWSSDVCSSDLPEDRARDLRATRAHEAREPHDLVLAHRDRHVVEEALAREALDRQDFRPELELELGEHLAELAADHEPQDRKSVAQGKRAAAGA